MEWENAENEKTQRTRQNCRVLSVFQLIVRLLFECVGAVDR
jgi:hypothetical protein